MNAFLNLLHHIDPKFEDEINVVEQSRYYSNNEFKIGQNNEWYTNCKFELWRVAI